MDHHPIFDRFTPGQAENLPEYYFDFIGCKFQRKFINLPSNPNPPTVQNYKYPCKKPAYDEEYFEWIDIFEAIENSGPEFNMVELGAGYGRWTIRAILAARQKGVKTINSVCVEAEPMHVKWISEAFKDNDISGDNHRIVDAAVSCEHGTLPFLVKPPEDWEETGAADWYGQSLTNMKYSHESDDEYYEGKLIKYFGNGWGAIDVPILPLSEILENDGIIDIIDMDIQGEEAKMVAGSVDYLNENVKRLHIGTHSRKIDASLIETLSTAGWHNIRTYLCNGEQETPYGTISFQDGVQSWINPKFS